MGDRVEASALVVGHGDEVQRRLDQAAKNGLPAARPAMSALMPAPDGSAP